MASTEVRDQTFEHNDCDEKFAMYGGVCSHKLQLMSLGWWLPPTLPHLKYHQSGRKKCGPHPVGGDWRWAWVDKKTGETKQYENRGLKNDGYLEGEDRGAGGWSEGFFSWKGVSRGVWRGMLK